MTTSDVTASFDELRATLHLRGEAVTAIGATNNPTEATQVIAGLTKTLAKDLHPTAAGIAEVLALPIRSALIERFAGGFSTPLVVAWDTAGRCVISDAIDNNNTAVTATTFDLLRPLMQQRLRLHRYAPEVDRPPIRVSPATIARVLTTTDRNPENTDVLGDVRFAWHARGSWVGQPTDRAVTVLASQTSGLWGFVPEDDKSQSKVNPESPIVLVPLTVSDTLTELGNIVTGRVAVST